MGIHRNDVDVSSFNIANFRFTHGMHEALIVVFVGGMAGVIALVCMSGFMSLVLPTIFGLGCANLGKDTKLAASGQIMAILGGAIITPLQGFLVDERGASQSYLLPFACFLVIGTYAAYGRRYEDLGK